MKNTGSRCWCRWEACRPGTSSHNHGSGTWVPPIWVSFHLGWFSTSMIMGERVFGWIICKSPSRKRGCYILLLCLHLQFFVHSSKSVGNCWWQWLQEISRQVQNGRGWSGHVTSQRMNVDRGCTYWKLLLCINRYHGWRVTCEAFAHLKLDISLWPKSYDVSHHMTCTPASHWSCNFHYEQISSIMSMDVDDEKN